MNEVGILLLVLGSLIEFAGVLCLVVPTLKFTIPRPVAILVLILGGLLQMGGILT